MQLCEHANLFMVPLPYNVESLSKVEDEVAHSRCGDDEKGNGDEQDGVVTHPQATLKPHLYCH